MTATAYVRRGDRMSTPTTKTKSRAKKATLDEHTQDQDPARESSLLFGGPRAGRAYWTSDLDDNVAAYNSNSEGYARTDEFVENRHAPGGVSRVWEWTS